MKLIKRISISCREKGFIAVGNLSKLMLMQNTQMMTAMLQAYLRLI